MKPAWGGAWSRRAVLLLFLLVAASSGVGQSRGEPQPPPSGNNAHAIAEQWGEQVLGKHYYIKSLRDGLLKNDEISVVRCKIRYSPTTAMDTDVVTPAYRAKLWFEGVFPAPPVQFRLDFEDFPNIEGLLGRLEHEFSRSALEDAYNWPPEVKVAVRYRYIALGMDKDMVELALGGLTPRVDLEKLDDGRVRETWKLQVRGDTRKIFTERTAFLSAHTEAMTQIFGTFSALTQALGRFGSETSGGLAVQSTTTAQTTAVAGESGSLVFSGLPPEFLNIIFTDGRVTARKTEFVK